MIILKTIQQELVNFFLKHYARVYMTQTLQVAQAIIEKCKNANYSINQTKIQKLLYAVYGVYLAKYNEPPFNERPICMPYGPVFSDTLNTLKGYSSFKWNLCNFKSGENTPITESLNSVIDYVIESLGEFSAIKLVNWSHRKGSAWSIVNDNTEAWGETIPDSEIKKEFAQLKD